MRAADSAARAGDDRYFPTKIRHAWRIRAWTSRSPRNRQLIRETAREFCAREVVPFARDWDRSERMDPGDRRQARRGRLPRLRACRRSTAGSALDMVSYCLVMEELGKADSSVRGIASVNNGLAGKTIAKWGTAEPRSRSGCRGCARARRSAATRSPSPARARIPARSSRAPSATAATGCSPARRSSSRSARGRGWRSSSPARAARGRGGSRASSCRRASDGFSSRKIDGKLGLRAQDTAELFLDGVRVPDSALLGEEGAGLQGGDVGARQRADLARRRLGRDRAGLPRRVDGVREGADAVRAADRAATSSYRSCSPTWRSRRRRRG